MSLLHMFLALALASIFQDAERAAPEPAPAAEPVALELVKDPSTGLEMLRGVHRVPENRATREGRTLGLDIVVLPAIGEDPAPDPVFFIAGGPGQRATDVVGSMAKRYAWLRERRDLVFVDQRGTGGDHRLQCTPSETIELQTLLDPLFERQWLVDCAERLSKRADLTMYTTPIAADDLDEVRRALGYDEINLIGGSYGTRASLVYLRRHESSVRSMVLDGVAPIAFRNPLYHAQGAQDALEGLVTRCADDPDCAEAFPDPLADLAAVLERLEKEPAPVTIPHPLSGESVELRLSREAFAESLRGMLYSSRTARRIPLLLRRAAAGDLAPFASFGVQRSLALSRALSLGMLLCVTCPEDVARIREDEISAATQGTFLGDGRVRMQRSICEEWPSGSAPAAYGEPVRSDVPVLLLSGTLDPVTPPRWGAEAARHLSRSRHVVVEGAHGVGGPCIDSIVGEFLESPESVSTLDTGCAAKVKLPPFDLGR